MSTKIAWTDETWNPVSGCTKLSAGCRNCYAEPAALSLKRRGQHKYADGFEVRMHEYVLDQPRHWRKPRLVFVNSMSDLFHDEVTDDFIHAVFDVMVDTPQHTYQILTKRPERMAALAPELPWLAHIWAGVTVEDNNNVGRVDVLRAVPSAVHFLSAEPLLGPVPDLDLTDIDWVIAGGESGPHCRPMDTDWVRDVRDRCVEAEIPFFFKQHAGFNKKRSGRVLDGRTWDEFPERKAS